MMTLYIHNFIFTFTEFFLSNISFEIDITFIIDNEYMLEAN